MLDVPDEDKQKLFQSQFQAQSHHYHTHFGDADFLIVMKENTPIGKITVHDRVDEIRVIDLAILPGYRSAGVGTQLMLDVIKTAEFADKPVRIHVEKMNRAISFYERLGFKTIGEKDYHWLLECAPKRKLITP